MYLAAERSVMVLPLEVTVQIVMGNGQRLRYLPIGKRRLANVRRADARRESWLAILANFLKAHRALGLFFRRKSQVHRAHGDVTSAGLRVTIIFVGLGRWLTL